MREPINLSVHQTYWPDAQIYYLSSINISQEKSQITKKFAGFEPDTYIQRPNINRISLSFRIKNIMINGRLRV